MPQPTVTDVHVDALLTNISVAYIQNTANFIAPRVFPAVPVDKLSDKYFIYTKNDWFRDEAEKRGDTAETVGSGYTVSTTNYQCDVYALHKDIGDFLRMNADAPLRPDQEATEFITSRLLLRLEKQWATDFFTTGVWSSSDFTGVAGAAGANQFVQWSDYANSDPINDIENGKEAILGTTGFMPNTLVMGYQVFRQLQHHPDIVDRYKYTTNQVITEDLLARLFGVDRILVCRGISATNNEGATAAYSFIQGKAALLCYVPASPGLLTPSAGYTFLWRGISAGLGQPAVIRRFRIEPRRADRIEGEIAFVNKVIGSDLGKFYATAVA